jgi:hypothetical protein
MGRWVRAHEIWPLEKGLLTGLHAVGQIKGWKVQQLVFVGGT